MAECIQATDKALEFIDYMKSLHGPILIFQSSGCCDGSAPMCYKEEDFRVGEQDLLLGIFGDVPFYIHKSHYEYMKHTQLILDVKPGRGASFSLDSIEKEHFVIESRVYE